MFAAWWVPFFLVLNRSQFLENSISSLGPLVAERVAASSNRTEQRRSSICNKFTIFRERIHRLVSQDPSLAGPLVRLAFHDATTHDVGNSGGPNGSIQYELGRSENRGLARPLKLLRDQIIRDDDDDDDAMTLGMSLADAIALGGAQAIETVGGPRVPIRMGRPDATLADAEFLQHSLHASTPRSLVTKTLPSAGLDSDGLRLYFRHLKFTIRTG